MGLFDDDDDDLLDSIIAERKSKFEPIDLNSHNIQVVFNKCLATDEEKLDSNKHKKRQILKKQLAQRESEEISLSTEQTQNNKQTVQFLLGQIKNVHGKLPVITLNEGFVRYDDTVWTKDFDMLFRLYLLAQACGYLSDFGLLKNNPNLIAANKASDLTPTLSPRDPNFKAWWEEHKSEWEKSKKEAPEGPEGH